VNATPSNVDKKIISHHKRVIRKLQDKLRKPITPFIMFEAFGLWFYKLNPELFKEDVNNETVMTHVHWIILIFLNG
jgi:hypothetical protein